MNNSQGKQLINDEVAERIVEKASKHKLVLSTAAIQLEIRSIPAISNAQCFYMSLWSSFTKEQLREFFPLTLKDRS